MSKTINTGTHDVCQFHGCYQVFVPLSTVIALVCLYKDDIQDNQFSFNFSYIAVRVQSILIAILLAKLLKRWFCGDGVLVSLNGAATKESERALPEVVRHQAILLRSVSGLLGLTISTVSRHCTNSVQFGRSLPAIILVLFFPTLCFCAPLPGEKEDAADPVAVANLVINILETLCAFITVVFVIREHRLRQAAYAIPLDTLKVIFDQWQAHAMKAEEVSPTGPPISQTFVATSIDSAAASTSKSFLTADINLRTRVAVGTTTDQDEG